jgi:hypothetical protein
VNELTALPVKLAIRTDKEARVVRAYIASLDGTTFKAELGTIDYAALDGIDGPLFRRWMDLMRDAMASIIAQTIGPEAAEKIVWTGDLNPDDLERTPQG